MCFCKKEMNPANHLWLVPHSCGEVCEKPLKSEYGLCSHRCTVLCHPGPCPPCSQTISTSCECTKSNLRIIRCAQRSWKCGNKVGNSFYAHRSCIEFELKFPHTFAIMSPLYNFSAWKSWHVEFMCAKKFVIKNVRRARKRANKNANVEINLKSVIVAA